MRVIIGLILFLFLSNIGFAEPNTTDKKTNIQNIGTQEIGF